MSKLIRAAVAATLCAALSSTAFAASTAKMAPQVVHVSLLGEAGQPMSVKMDTMALKAGAVEFDVSNDAVGTDHEAVLVKLKDANQKIVADMKKHRVDEAKLKSLGEVAGLKAGEHGMLKATLEPGDYAIICNHKSHYELGMATRFTVTK